MLNAFCDSHGVNTFLSGDAFGMIRVAESLVVPDRTELALAATLAHAA